MSIEFRCTSCQKLLQVKDESAGKNAKCPECGTVLAIPAVSTPATSPPPEDDNPFASPEAPNDGMADATPSANRDMVPTTIDLGDVFSDAWSLFKAKMGLLLGAYWLAVLAPLLLVLVAVGLIQVSELLGVVAVFASYALMILIAISLIRFELKVARGQPADIGDIFDFSSSKYFLRLLGASLIVGIGVNLGYLLCIIPGVLLGLMWSQFAMLIIDRDAGAIDSLSMSNDITNGNKMTLFLMGLCILGLSIVASIPLGLGLIVLYPFVVTLSVVAYLKMIGEPVATS